MSAEQTFVGIDIGTTEVRTVVGMLTQDQEIPSVIGAGSAQNHGMRRGVVINIDEVAASIVRSVEEAERISGQRVDSAIVSINGAHILGLTSKGVVAIGGPEKEIAIEDLARAEEAATVVQLPANRDILQVFARNYQIDGQDNIKDPIGMSGVRLEVEALIVTSSTPAIKALDRAMDRAGITSKHRIVSGLAASEAVLEEVQRESGSVVLDIGTTTTNVVVVEEDDVQHIAVLPVGSLHITNDLAIGLKTDIGVADIVKLEHTNLSKKEKTTKHITVEYADQNYTFDKSDIDSIVNARLEELFELTNEELKKINRSGKLPGGVVLAGGGALLPGIDEVAKNYLGLPAHIGTSHNYSGIVDTVKSPRFATAVGLMLLDMRMQEGNEKLSQSSKSITQTLKQLLKKFIP
jgi:cell division protein FtsA